tara:strand:- start:197 stop:472 length:276 start_codon:yes stop_codon:yes gene_type:complete
MNTTDNIILMHLTMLIGLYPNNQELGAKLKLDYKNDLRNDNEIIRDIKGLIEINSNDQELGRIFRQAYKDSLKAPERSCDIEDEDCISCGA